MYEGQWKQSVPYGPAKGALSNSSQDLLFSMERLSVNPYAVRRLNPATDGLPFQVDPYVTKDVAGTDLETLAETGRLFYVDHSYQAHYPIAEGRYAAACSAYFFIHPKSDLFLPLAIKTNVGENLVYTPLDDPEDWLLAKAMFNMNDLFHGQIFHLANSHAVVEPIYLAALRTMSSNHPIMALLTHCKLDL